jgi:outer membrane protein OmpA-like peptidoglycan-associated protein
MGYQYKPFDQEFHALTIHLKRGTRGEVWITETGSFQYTRKAETVWEPLLVKETGKFSFTCIWKFECTKDGRIDVTRCLKPHDKMPHKLGGSVWLNELDPDPEKGTPAIKSVSMHPQFTYATSEEELAVGGDVPVAPGGKVKVPVKAPIRAKSSTEQSIRPFLLFVNLDAPVPKPKPPKPDIDVTVGPGKIAHKYELTGFAFDKTTLDPQYHPGETVEALVKKEFWYGLPAKVQDSIMKGELPGGTMVVIKGYCDKTGKYEHNENLGKERALKVYNALRNVVGPNILAEVFNYASRSFMDAELEGRDPKARKIVIEWEETLPKTTLRKP